MSAETTLPGLGTKLQRKITSTYTDVAQLLTLDPPSMEMGTAETTHLGSTSRAFRKTIFDGGEVSATIEYDPNGTTHGPTEVLVHTGTLEDYKIVYPDGNTTPASHQFFGIMTGFQPTGIEIEGILQAEIKIKVSGAVTFTAGTP